jgi:hypothetical protein
MYRYRYINMCSQFGRTNCTLLLDDLETQMPSVRIDKEFGMPLNELDDETLYQEAAIEIVNATQAYNDAQAELAAEAAADDIDPGS